MKLHSEKLPEHMAAVTVGSLTSTAVDMESRSHLAEGRLTGVSIKGSVASSGIIEEVGVYVCSMGMGLVWVGRLSIASIHDYRFGLVSHTTSLITHHELSNGICPDTQCYV